MINDKGNLQAKAQKILCALGGIKNIEDGQIDNCATRLRIQVKDMGAVDEKLLRRQGALGFIRLPENQIQVVFFDVHNLAEELRTQAVG
ncbi:PTS transporter subunit EIIB [Vibrio brasiliensis]|jgi:glucose-like phosphotransferase system IIB component|uniref:Phosphotransferase system EIIC n=1 Tax=Vibrio brasiliensis LMG 20546 TaxID=945543 RepID=E8LWR1_9VIBR|nr:PTS transporter subunit EIIB [Vibrio brasiliensis]EGA64812.1 phosphotransferase system EIIC [Vibrio brasiliensis LMG 20546]